MFDCWMMKESDLVQVKMENERGIWRVNHWRNESLKDHMKIHRNQPFQSPTPQHAIVFDKKLFSNEAEPCYDHHFSNHFYTHRKSQILTIDVRYARCCYVILFSSV